MKQVYFVLHGHLPWVLHHHNQNYEKTWVFETTAECHLRLLESFHKIDNAKISYSISPTLLSMWLSKRFKVEFEQYLLQQIYISEQEVKRTSDSEYEDVAKFYLNFWQERYNYWKKIGCNLIEDLSNLQQHNKIELLTSAASHPILPLLPSQQWVNLQVKSAVNLFNNVFGFQPKSLWLPECAISEEILPVLEANNIENIFIAEHAVSDTFIDSVLKKGNIKFFLRDRETAERVWSREIGYPGHPDYREYYRDIGWDLPLEQIREYLSPWEFSRFTGFKYYRITGKDCETKQIYDHHQASLVVKQQAEDFIAFLSKYRKENITCIYDAELFGHWWFEGPEWLTHILQNHSYLNFTTLDTDIVPSHIDSNAPICSSSWGEKGYFDVWLNEKNEWMYHQLVDLSHTVEQKIDLISPAHQELLLRLTMLFQASDWPFMVYYDSAASYARFRFDSYRNDILTLLESGSINTEKEEILSFLPGLNLFEQWNSNKFYIDRPAVLLLAWEYPPLTVGGLATHVFYLAKYIQDFIDVHVITRGSTYSVDNEGNVTVHRIPLPSYENQDFINWILLLNIEFTKYIINNFVFNTERVIIHAHDWLVGLTGITLQEKGIGHLIATIHATEYGRQGGRLNQISHMIHQQEASLISKAEEIIVCSNYMKNEVTELFGNQGKIHFIPNGIELQDVHANHVQADIPDDFILFYGRLVPEKGVQTLIQAFREISLEHPDLYLLIGGKGYYEAALKEIAATSGVGEKIRFLGFLKNNQRELLLKKARIVCFPSLYEPFGIVALEAMAAGKPVIAGKTGGLGEIIEDGITGLLFKPGDFTELATQIKIFLVNQALANKCATTARETVVARYNWRDIAENTYRLYQKFF